MEGEKDYVYLDTLHHPTVGIGHKVLPEDHLKLGDTVTPAQVDAFFSKDGGAALKAAHAQAQQAGITDPDFTPALASINFQLGGQWNGPKHFKQTWADMLAGDYTAAADEAARSRWYLQAPNRVAMFQDGLRRLASKRGP